MLFRKSTQDDIDEICRMVTHAAKVMDGIGIHQWDEIYPTRENFASDVREDALFIGTEGNEIAVVFALSKHQEPEYLSAEWEYRGEAFCVIHRLCVNPVFQNRGVAKETLRYIEEHLKSKGVSAIRLDVFTENPYALKLYNNNGYHTTGSANWRKRKFLLMEKLL